MTAVQEPEARSTGISVAGLCSCQRSASHIITPMNAMRDAVALWEPEQGKCTVNPYGTINDAFVPDKASSLAGGER